MTVRIDGRKLKADGVVRVARPGLNGRFEKAALDPAARERIAATRRYIDANWMNDDAPLMEWLLEQGVDGIFTDRVDTLKDVLTAHGRWT